MRATSQWPAAIRAVVHEAREENVPLLAASIAYNAFISLLPLLLFLFFLTAAIGNETLSQQVVELTEGILASGAQGVLADALRNASARAGASFVGVVTLLWGSLKIFRGLDTAFSEIYDTAASDSFLDQVKDGLLVFAALGVAVVAAVAAGAVFAAFEEVPFVGVLSPLFLVLGLMVAFFPVYYVFPDLDLSVREVLPGVVVAAVGWTVLEVLFQVYVEFADKQEVYGAIGGILLLLTWLYFGGLVLLSGAVVNAVLAGRTDTATETAPAGEGSDADDQTTAEEHGVSEQYEALEAAYEDLERDYAELQREHRELEAERADLRREREEHRRERAELLREREELRRELADARSRGVVQTVRRWVQSRRR